MVTADKRLFDFLYEQQQNTPLGRAFGHKVNGEWRYFSSTEMVQWTERLAQTLAHLGLKSGDRVATVVYRATPEWVALDNAMLLLGVISVPMYPTISAREYEYILTESEARFCVVGDGDLLEKVSAAQPKVPTLEAVFAFGDEPRPGGVRTLNDLLAAMPATTPVPRGEQVKPDDVATFIYTSGTTGNPKGVVLTHRNIVFNVETMRNLIPIGPGERGLSFLPVSHIFERAVVYAYTAYGASVSFTTPDELGGESGDLQAVKPHFFSAVPRLLEKVYERIYDKGLELEGFKRAVFFWSMKLADRWDFDPKRDPWTAFQWWLADRLVFKKWRAALGGNVNGIVVGASACPVRVMRAFNAAGIRVREGYGMTEAAPAVSFNQFVPGGALLGSVGQAVEGVTVRIEEGSDYRPGEGEILVNSPGVMVGYYRQSEKTAEVIRIDPDGSRWLCTGDVGMLVKSARGGQFLRITDRKKELLKTSGGKYVAPTPIEARFKEHRLVEQVMVVGDDLKFVSALIVPALAGLQDWCQKHNVAWTNLAEMVRHPQVIERYQMLVDRVNPYFSHFEQVKKFVLLPNPWEAVKTDGSEVELTPTLKLKRRVISQKFQSQIAALYD